MLSVSISFVKISMCSCSAKPDLDTGKEDVNARNPADPEPCVAKWITSADLNQYNLKNQAHAEGRCTPGLKMMEQS